MTLTWSRRFPFVRRHDVCCDEPWVGLFSIETNLDVTFCPCYLQMKLGNLEESTLPALWNAPPLVSLRKSFAKGRLPGPCRGQLCPVATSARRGVVFDRRLALNVARPLVRALRRSRETARRVTRRFA